MAKHEFLRRTYLQIFNDEGENGGQGAGDEGDAGKGGSDQQNEDAKMVNMTQEEYDKSIQKRLDRGKKSWEKEFHESDDYKAFQEHQENKKTSDQKIQDQLKNMDSLKQSNADLTSKIQAYEQKDQLTKAEVNPEFTDYVMFEIQKSMSDDVDFETALKGFKENESNAKYFGSQQQRGNNGRQGQRHGGSASKGSTASNILSKMYGDK